MAVQHLPRCRAQQVNDVMHMTCDQPPSDIIAEKKINARWQTGGRRDFGFLSLLLLQHQASRLLDRLPVAVPAQNL